jgi:6-phosphogluconate dehydrogenase
VFVAALARPRRLLVLVKAGPAVEAVLGELAGHLEAGGLLIDGGTSFFADSVRRERALAAAVFARVLSARRPQWAAAAGVLGGPAGRLEAGRVGGFVEEVCDVLYASKVVADARGFEQSTAAADGWEVELGGLATSWRGGGSIWARFLDRRCEADAADPGLGNLLFAGSFGGAVGRAQAAWRRVVATAGTLGVPTPVFASSLACYGGLRRERGPAKLLRGLRDGFGAHTYRRIDRPGRFHTRWTTDRPGGPGVAMQTTERTDLDRLAVDTVRVLAVDTIHRGRQRPSGDGDGAGPGRLRAVDPIPQVRPGRP